MLVLRRRGVLNAWISAIALFVGLLFLPKGMFEVVGRYGVYNHLWPIYFSFMGVVPIVIQRTWVRDDERLAPGGRRRRLDDLLLLYAGVLIASFVAINNVDIFAISVRNAVTFTALSSCLFWFVKQLAWLPGVGFGFLIWLLGTDLNSNPVPWALPLQPISHIGAMTTAGVLLGCSFILAAQRL